MENKLYYTPTIEEFHVGFECELRNSSGPIFEWEPFKIIGVDDGEISGNLMDWSFYDTRTAIKDEQIRVKYLDKSDIESLGWKTHNNDVFTLGKMIKDAPEDWHNLGNWKYRLMISQVIEPVDPCRIFIDNRNPSNGGANQIFRGTIKNKSELIKLMQQLNIK